MQNLFSYFVSSQPTLRREGNARLMGASSKKGKHTVSPPTFIRGKCRKNQKDNGLHVLKMRVRELFAHGEGISTPHARHKGRWPSIKCANMTSKLFIFPIFMFLSFYAFFYFFIFLWSTRVFPSLLRILNCDEEIRPT